IPFRLYTQAVRYRNMSMIRLASILTMVGIILNRLNTSIIAYNWTSVDHYIPTWMEIEITLMVIFAEIIVLRWIVNRMPILSDPPDWAKEENENKEETMTGFIITKKEPE
ncbi:MAG: hypothetical protein KAR38_17350, partial [Calditrichia bacterium]|nr:hypothetical protein [Calditrichia bacterium]